MCPNGLMTQAKPPHPSVIPAKAGIQSGAQRRALLTQQGELDPRMRGNDDKKCCNNGELRLAVDFVQLHRMS